MRDPDFTFMTLEHVEDYADILLDLASMPDPNWEVCQMVTELLRQKIAVFCQCSTIGPENHQLSVLRRLTSLQLRLARGATGGAYPLDLGDCLLGHIHGRVKLLRDLGEPTGKRFEYPAMSTARSAPSSPATTWAQLSHPDVHLPPPPQSAPPPSSINSVAELYTNPLNGPPPSPDVVAAVPNPPSGNYWIRATLPGQQTERWVYVR